MRYEETKNLELLALLLILAAPACATPAPPVQLKPVPLPTQRVYLFRKRIANHQNLKEQIHF